MSKQAKIRIIGDSPLIVHAWSEKAKKELLASQQGTKLKKDKKQAKNVYGEIAEALYWMNGKPDVAYADWTEELLDKYAASEQFGFPACAVKAAAVSAAFRLGWTKDKVSARGAWAVRVSSVRTWSDVAERGMVRLARIGKATCVAFRSCRVMRVRLRLAWSQKIQKGAQNEH